MARIGKSIRAWFLDEVWERARDILSDNGIPEAGYRKSIFYTRRQAKKEIRRLQGQRYTVREREERAAEILQYVRPKRVIRKYLKRELTYHDVIRMGTGRE